MTLRLRSLAPLVLALLLGACSADTGTVVFVTLRGRLAMPQFSTLDILVSNGGGSASQTLTLQNSDRLPLSFTVTPTGRSGTLNIVATAHLADGQSAGRGSVDVTIVPDQRVDKDLVLEPDDFLVNKSIANAQFIVFDENHNGRQIAVGSDGGFITTFENDCPLGRCDVLARLFDRSAQPARNATSADDGDFIVNQVPEFNESPVIAAGSNGYLVAWVSRTTSSDGNVKATVLGRDGGHLSDSDIAVSVAVEEERLPSVFTLADGNYVIVWQQVRPADGSQEVHARLFGPDGTPRVNGVSHTSDDFRVSALAGGDQLQAHGVGLPGGGFVIVWLNGAGASNNVLGRIFAADGTPAAASDLPITQYSGALLYGPHVAATKEGFVAGWQASSSTIPALSGRPLIVRRFSASGAALSTEIPVVAKTTFFRAAPTLAVRSSDGALGVTWPECGDDGDIDKSCGIRFRLLRPTGQPVGDSLVVNTTHANDQVAPSIAPVAEDGFVLGWTDSSNAPPDTVMQGVRARVIYPALERHDGKLGAQCGEPGDVTCGDALTCQPAADGKSLCHATCTGNTCPGGGTCINSYCSFL